MIAFAQLGPSSWQELSHPANCFSHAEPGGGIERSRPIEAILKFSVAATWPIVAVADDRRLQIGLFVFAGPKKSGAFRGANPFVQVPRGIVPLQSSYSHRH